uniref:Replicase polyprotein 1ab n=1 Tax=Berne virus TaxID=11156 RepID=R1AB_BEV|nr:RecName: Full=Replicase polyprotein 1ab; Short=pp1ab; AltName: Full=ORF1ab polyprotein; Contains: RecName: Full=Non-structural protein 1; Short=nsp1; Contains: RecName: Full=Non-structural protein 2; Short=nsp2; Contains: RecName: Full=3C-like serine proteinase; Short=3CLSP; AltName: Full=M-PRO; AltName: Full=nsp3; AltName: Full=p27; Contains: RecName: Full=Non-structural protein 4; Short=nsp4; Contains: RecName: Full=Non-structural protein 5; Short=nsp5; Contains: RecName: Full=Non-structural p
MSTSSSILDIPSKMFRILKNNTRETEQHLSSSTLDLISKSQLLAQCFDTQEIMASLSKTVRSILESQNLEHKSTLTPYNSSQSLQLLVMNTSCTQFKWTTGSTSSVKALLEKELCRGLVPLNDITPKSNYVELSLLTPSILIGNETSTTTTLPEIPLDMEQSIISCVENTLLKEVQALSGQESCQEYFLSANYQSLIPPQVLLNLMKMSSVVDLSPLTLPNTRLWLKLSPFHGGTSVSYATQIKGYANCARREEKCLKNRLTKKQKNQEKGSFDARSVITLGGKMYRYKVVVLRCEDQSDNLSELQFEPQVEYTMDMVPHCWKELVKKRLIRAKGTWDLSCVEDLDLDHVEVRGDSLLHRSSVVHDLTSIVDDTLQEKLFSRTWLRQSLKYSGNILQRLSSLFATEGLKKITLVNSDITPVQVGDKWLNFVDFGKSTVFFVKTLNNIHLAMTRQRESCNYIHEKFGRVRWLGAKPEQGAIVKVFAWCLNKKEFKFRDNQLKQYVCRQGVIKHEPCEYLNVEVLDEFVALNNDLNCVQKIKTYLAAYFGLKKVKLTQKNFMTPLITKKQELVFQPCNCPNHQFYVAQFDKHVTLGLGRKDGILFAEQVPSYAIILAVGFGTVETQLVTHYYSEMRRVYHPLDFQSNTFVFDHQGVMLEDISPADYNDVGEEDYQLEYSGGFDQPFQNYHSDDEDQAFPDFEDERHPDEENWARPIISSGESSVVSSRPSSPLVYSSLVPVASPFGYMNGIRVFDICLADDLDFLQIHGQCPCARCKGLYFYQPIRPRGFTIFENVVEFFSFVEKCEVFEEIGPFFKMIEYSMLYNEYNIFYGLGKKIYQSDLVLPVKHLDQLWKRAQLDIDVVSEFENFKNSLQNINNVVYIAPYFNDQGEWNDIFDGYEFNLNDNQFWFQAKPVYDLVCYIYQGFFSDSRPLEKLYQKLCLDYHTSAMLHTQTHLKYCYVALLHSERAFQMSINLDSLDNEQLHFLATMGMGDASLVGPTYLSEYHSNFNWYSIMSKACHYVKLEQLVGLTYQEKRLMILSRVQEFYEQQHRGPIQLILSPLKVVNLPPITCTEGYCYQPVTRLFDTCVMPDIMKKLSRKRTSVSDVFGILADYFKRTLSYRCFKVHEFCGIERQQEFSDMTTLKLVTDWCQDTYYFYNEYATMTDVEPKVQVSSDYYLKIPSEVVEHIRQFLPHNVNVGLMNYVSSNCDFDQCKFEFCLSGKGYVLGNMFFNRCAIQYVKTNLFIVLFKSRPLLYITQESIYLSDFNVLQAQCLTGEFCLDFEPVQGKTLFGVYFTNGQRYGQQWETLPRFSLKPLNSPRKRVPTQPFEELAEVCIFKQKLKLTQLHNDCSVTPRVCSIPQTITATFQPYYCLENFYGVKAPKVIVSGHLATHYVKLTHKISKCVLVTKLAVARAFYFTPTSMGSHYHLDPMEGISFGKRATVQFEPVGLIKDVNLLVYQFGSHVSIQFFPEAPCIVADGHYPSKYSGVWLGYLPSVEECKIAQVNHRVYVPTILRTSKSAPFHIIQNGDMGRGPITVTYHYAKNFDNKSLTPMFKMFQQVFEKSKDDIFKAFNTMSLEQKKVLSHFCGEFDEAYTLQTMSDEISFESSAYPDVVACSLAYILGYEMCLTVKVNAKNEKLDIGSQCERVFVDYDVKKNEWTLSPEEGEDSDDNLDLPFEQYYEFKIGQTNVVLVQDDFKSVFEFLKSEQGVDYVVNPANSQLKHGGGIAKVISCMCGPKLQAWSNNYITKNKTVPVTKAIKSPGFQLGKKVNIIHAVGPRVSDGDVFQKLDQAWRSVFDLCEDQHTILTSMLSTGIFGCTVNDSFNTFLSNVARLDKSLVVFVVTNMVEQYNQAFAVIKMYQQYHGLPNFGNTCWFNALYQLLKSFSEKEQCVNDLLNCFDDFYDCPTSQCVEWVCEQLGVQFGQQQDAVEMLMKVFDVFKCDVRVGFDCLSRLQQVNCGFCVEVPAQAVLMFSGKDQCGHWTAARKIVDKWYTFDDNHVVQKDPVWQNVVLVLRDRGIFRSADFERKPARRRRVSHRVPRDTLSQDAITYIEDLRFSSGTCLSRYFVESVESFVSGDNVSEVSDEQTCVEVAIEESDGHVEQICQSSVDCVGMPESFQFTFSMPLQTFVQECDQKCEDDFSQEHVECDQQFEPVEQVGQGGQQDGQVDQQIKESEQVVEPSAPSGQESPQALLQQVVDEVVYQIEQVKCDQKQDQDSVQCDEIEEINSRGEQTVQQQLQPILGHDLNENEGPTLSVGAGKLVRCRSLAVTESNLSTSNTIFVWSEVLTHQYIGFKTDLMGLTYNIKFKLICYVLFLWFGVLCCTSHNTPFYMRLCIYLVLLWLSLMIWNASQINVKTGWNELYVLKLLTSIKLPNIVKFRCELVQWFVLKCLFVSFYVYDYVVKVCVSIFQMPQLRPFTWPFIKLGFVDTFLSHHILAFPEKVANQSTLPTCGDKRYYVYVPSWCRASFTSLVMRARELTSTGRSKTLDNWHYQCCSKTAKPLSCFNVREFVFDQDCKHEAYGFLSSLCVYLLFYSGFLTFWLPLFCYYYVLFMCTFKNLPVDITKPIKWTVLQQVVNDVLSLVTKPLFGRPVCPPLTTYLTSTTADEAVKVSRSLLGRFCTPLGFQQPVMNVENGVTVSNFGFFNPLMWPLFVVVLLDNRFIWFFNVLSYVMMPVFVIILFYFYLKKICGCINFKGLSKCCTKHFNQFSKPLVAAGVHGNRTNFTYQPMQEHWCDRHSWYCPKEEHYMTPDMAVYIKNYYNLACAPTADLVWCDYTKSAPTMTWSNFKYSSYKAKETVLCAPSSHADSMLMAWYALLHNVRFTVNPNVVDLPPAVNTIYVSSDSEDSVQDKSQPDVKLRPKKPKGNFKKQSVAYFSREPVDIWYYTTLVIVMGVLFMFMYSCLMVGQYVVMPRDKFFGVNPTGYSYVNAPPYLHAAPPVLQNSDGMILATQLKVPSITYSVYRLLSGHLYFTKLIVSDNECTPPFGAARLSNEFSCNGFTYVLPAHLRFFNRYVMLIHPDQLHMLPFEVEYGSHTRVCYTTGSNSVECLPTFEIISPYVFVFIVVIFTVIFLILIRLYIVMYSYFKVFTYVVFKLLFVNIIMVLFVVCLPPLVPGVVFVLALWLCDSVMFLLYLAFLSLFILPWFYVLFFLFMVGGFVFWWMMRSADVVHLTTDGLTFNGTFEQISKCVFPLNPLIVNRMLLDCQMSHSDLVEKSKLKTTEGKLANEMMKVFMTGETSYYQPSNFSFQSVFSKATSPFTLHARPPMPMFKLYVHFTGSCVGSTSTGTGFAIDDNTIVTAKHLFEYDDLKPTHVSVEIVTRSHSARSASIIWKEPDVKGWTFKGENAYIQVENLKDFYIEDFKYLPFQQIEKDFYKRMEPVTIYSVKYGSEFATQAWQTVNGHFVCYNTEGGDSGAPLVCNGRIVGVHQGLCDNFKTTLASDFEGKMMTEVKGHHVDPPVYYKPIIISAAYNKFVAGEDSSVGDGKNYHKFENEDFACMCKELESVTFGDQLRRYCYNLPQFLEPLQYFHVPSFWQPFKKQSVSNNVSWVVEHLHFIFSIYFLICDFVAYWWLDDPFSVVLPLFFIVQLLSTVFLKNVLFWTTSYLITLAVTFYIHSEVAESMFLLGFLSDRVVNRMSLIIVVAIMCLFVVVRVVVNVKRAIFVFVVSVVLIFVHICLGIVQFNSFVNVVLFDVYAVFTALLTPQPVVAIIMLLLFDTKMLMSFAFIVIVLSFRVFKDYKFVKVLHNFCNFDFVLSQVSLFRYRHRNQGNDPTHYEALWLFLKELYYGIQDAKYEVFSPQAGSYNVKFLTDMTEQDQLEAVEQVQRRLQRFNIVQDKASPRLVLYSKTIEFIKDQIQQQRAVGANPFIITTLTSNDIGLDNVEVHNPANFKPEDLQAHMWFFSKSPVFIGQVPIPTNVQTAAVLDTTYNCQDLTADEKNNVAATLQIQNAAITLSLFEKCTQFLESELGEVPTLMWQAEDVADIKHLESQIENLRKVLDGMQFGTTEYKATRKQLNICQSQLDQAKAFERKLAKFLEKVDQQQAITNETAKQLSAFKNLVKQVYESYMSSLKVKVLEANDASCLLTSTDLPRKLVLMRPITGVDGIKIVEKANGCEITAFGTTFNTGHGSNLAGLAYSTTQPLSAYPFIFNLEGIFKQQANIGYKTVECNMSSHNGSVLYKGKVVAVPSDDNPDFVVCGKGYKLDCGINVLMIPSIVRYITLNLTDHLQKQSLKPRRRLQYRQQGVRLGGVNLGEHQAFSNELISTVGYTTWVSSTVCRDNTHKHPWFVQIPVNEKDPEWFMHNTQLKDNQWVVDLKPTHWLVNADTGEQLFALSLTDEQALKAEAILQKWSPITQDVECWFKDLKGYYTVSGFQPLWPVCPVNICNVRLDPVFKPQSIVYADDPTHFLSLPVVNKNFLAAFYDLQEGFPGKKQVAPHISLTMLKLSDEDIEKVEDILDEMVLPNSWVTITNPHMMGKHYVCDVEGLDSLHDEVVSVLREHGIACDQKRLWKPHLTIGELNDVSFDKFKDFAISCKLEDCDFVKLGAPKANARYEFITTLPLGDFKLLRGAWSACRHLCFQNGAYQSSRSKHYIDLATEYNAGIVKVNKSNTHSVEYQSKRFMIKRVKDQSEFALAKTAFLPSIIPHHMEKQNGEWFLIRGPTSQWSLGDLVYAIWLGDQDYLSECGFVFNPSRDEFLDDANQRSFLANLLEPAILNFSHIYWQVKMCKVPYKLTLDNVDLNGQLYDFGDYPCPNSVDNQSALFVLAEVWSMTRRPFPVAFARLLANEMEIPTDYQMFFQNILLSGSYLDKALCLNNVRPFLSDPANLTTTPFFSQHNGVWTHFYNPIYGLVECNLDEFAELPEVLQQLVTVQGPITNNMTPAISVGEGVYAANVPSASATKQKIPFYDVGLCQELTDAGVDCGEAFKYFYYLSNPAGALADVCYYDYQGTGFYSPKLLAGVYDFMKRVTECYRINERFTYEQAKPRKSSMGINITGYQQDAVYRALGPENIARLFEYAQKAPLPFCTKIITKFALSAKARARTVSSCSFIASTIFRFAHKPVTSKMVEVAQNSGGFCLIGVSKYGLKFSKFLKDKYGAIEGFDVFGSDYTKCDRTFPLSFRALTAALLYELGEWDEKSWLYLNEVNSYMLDTMLCDGMLLNKPGGTSSGDATTAHSNTFYNYMVHYVVAFKTILSDLSEGNKVMRIAAHNAYTTGDYQVFNTLLEDQFQTNYFLNFLSDDSFIFSKPEALKIFTCENFSNKLQTILHTKVDQTKSWSTKGHIEEFCSAHIIKTDGEYHFLPSRGRLLASLLILDKLSDVDIYYMRFVAILCESAVYSRYQPEFFNGLFQVFLDKVQQFRKDYCCDPCPPQLLEREFYENLVFTSNSEVGIVDCYLENFKLQCEFKQQANFDKVCFCCPNPAVSVCEECYVPLPLCAYCYYVHVVISNHSKVEDKFKCFCGQDNIRELYIVLNNSICMYQCKNCVESDRLRISLLSDVDQIVRLPGFKSNSASIAKNGVAQLLTSVDNVDVSLDWNYQESVQQNVARIVYHSANMTQMSIEVVYVSFTLVRNDGSSAILDIPNFKCPDTSYCLFYKPGKSGVLKFTGKGTLTSCYDNKNLTWFKVTCPDFNQPWRLATCFVIQQHDVVYPPIKATQYENVTFVMGPPGTGKTTFVYDTYLSKASSSNRFVYCAPTHRLVGDMDEKVDGAVVVSAYNDRTYRNPVWNKDDSYGVLLCTHNTLPFIKSAVLIADEVSLIPPHVMIKILSMGFKKVVLLGDPFQLSPVYKNHKVHFKYDTFYLLQLATQKRYLTACYRCPPQILSAFSKPYCDVGVDLVSFNNKPGKFDIIVSKQLANIQDFSVLSVLSKEYPGYVILVNYRAAVDYAMQNGLGDVTTIDSSQGTTAANHLLVLFGASNFSKTVNRVIVGCSRSTTHLVVVCCPELFKHFQPILNWPEPKYRYFGMEKQSDFNIIPEVSSLVFCDIEFWHYKADPNSKTRTVYPGQIAVVTSQTLQLYLGVFDDTGYKSALRGLPKDVYVPPNWVWMRKHYPSYEQHAYNMQRLFKFIIDTTFGQPWFILYSCSNDLKSLKFYVEFDTCYFCSCGEMAICLMRDGNYKCRNCYGGMLISKLVNCKYLDVQKERVKLQDAHDAICQQFHGDSHEALCDAVMTKCLYLASYEAAFKDTIHVKYKDLCLEIQYKITSSFVRYDSVHKRYLYRDHGAMYYFRTPRSPMQNVYKYEVGSHAEYSINICTSYEGCQSFGKTCTKCIHIHCIVEQFMADERFKEFILVSVVKSDYVEQALSPAAKALMLTVTKVEDKSFYISNGVRYDLYDYDLSKSVMRVVNSNVKPLPLYSVIVGLGINCTVGCVLPNVPMKLKDELLITDVPLSTLRLDLQTWYYISWPTLSNKNSRWKLAGAQVYDCSVHIYIEATGEQPLYYLQQGKGESLFELPDTLFSTGRLYNLDHDAAQNFNVKQLAIETMPNNHHVFSGDFTEVGTDIGGVHHVVALNGYKGSIIPNYVKPIATGLINVGRAVKRTTLVDVCANQLYEKVKQQLEGVKVSKVIFVNIDFQDVQFMVFANGEDDIQTFYPQKDFVRSYYEWPNILPQIESHYDLKNYGQNPTFMPQPVNFAKYTQICTFIQDHVKVARNALVWHLGAAGVDGCSPGDIVLSSFFKECLVYSWDIKDYSTLLDKHSYDCNFRPNLIVSDIYNVSSNVSEVLDDCVHRLALGGTIVFKTTESSRPDIQLSQFTKYFSAVQFFTAGVNTSSSEVFVVLKYKLYSEPIGEELCSPNILSRIAAYRNKLCIVPNFKVFSTSFSYKYSGVKFVQKCFYVSVPRQFCASGLIQEVPMLCQMEH